jgi:hypothetical protein
MRALMSSVPPQTASTRWPVAYAKAGTSCAHASLTAFEAISLTAAAEGIGGTRDGG